MDIIEGYKVFNSDFTTWGGIKFEVGMHRHIDGKIKAGPIDGSGFHLCKNFEDTFRFIRENPLLCEVVGFGIISPEYTDDFYEYDGIYACSDLYVKRIVSREEIIDMAKGLSGYKLDRLIITYDMTEEEVAIIENNLDSFDKLKTKKMIDYYQRGNKNAFKEGYDG